MRRILPLLLSLAAVPSRAQAPAWDLPASQGSRAALESFKAVAERRAAFGGLEAQGDVEDLAFPGAPEGQPHWNYLTKPLLGAKARRARLEDGWKLDTTAQRTDSAGFFSLRVLRPKIDRQAGFSMRFRLALRSEAHVSDARAGTSVIVISDDLKGVELAFWKDQIWAQADNPLFSHGEGVAAATLAPAEYEISLEGERYRLSADGKPVLEGPLKDYSSFGFPYNQKSFLFYGDDTSSAAADMELRSLLVSYSR